MAKPVGPPASPVTEGAPDPLAPQGPPSPLAPQAPNVPEALKVLQQTVLHMLPLNWSHIKLEFSRKPDEDARAHLLRTNDCMDTHRFQDNNKRLWYGSLRPINADWLELQNSFRQQYSKIGNTREQLFHTWRFFHFDENMETIDAYMHHIRQVPMVLGYQEPQILENFKNTLPTRLHWVLLPIVLL